MFRERAAGKHAPTPIGARRRARSSAVHALFSTTRGLVQAPANRGGDRLRAAGPRARLRKPVQHAEHPPQAVEKTAALRALLDVAIQTRTGARGELAVEVGRHVSGRPAVIAGEAQAVSKVAHRLLDPAIAETGSHGRRAREPSSRLRRSKPVMTADGGIR